MLTSDPATLICDALVKGASELPDDYLAYLALSAKPENQIRDILAWTLHRDLGNRSIVAREWTSPKHVRGGRIDLAVLGPEADPRILVELKSFMTFNGVRPTDMARYQGYMRGDLDRLKRLDTDSDAIGILISVHAGNEVPQHLNRVVKYRPNINQSLRAMEPGTLWFQADAEIRRSLGVLGEVFTVSLGSGTAFGIECRLDAYLVAAGRPSRRADDEP